MSDSLTVFGTEYTGVTGIKATGTGNGTLTYIRPSGTKSIAANGTGIDVTEYASVNVAVPAQDNSLIVTVSWDNDYFGQNEGAWAPDCTWAEVSAAVQAGKEICMKSDEDMAPADGFWEGDPSFTLWYCVAVYSSSEAKFLGYALSQDGLALTWYDHISLPTGTINITQAGNTDVTQYATASVPLADEYAAVIGTDDQFVTITNKRYWQARARFLVDSPGWVSGDVAGDWQRYSAVPANTTITPSTSAQTVGGSKYMMEGPVTVAAMPTGTAGTPTATKGAVSNHSVSVTPSVTNVTGYITGGTVSGTAVTVTASELVSGSQTVTQNGTVDVTNLASVVVDVQGSTPSLHVGFISVQSSYTNNSLTFMNMLGEPTSWAVLSNGTIATSSTATVASVVSDGSSAVGQTITNTSNAQVSYNTGFSETYLADYSVFQVSSSSAQFGGNDGYSLVYTYGGGAIGTKQVQVGSGATSIAFTGLEDEPACWYVIFQSNFSTSSGYQRVIAVANNGTDTYGLEMDSSAHYSDQHWTSSYSNGSLTITSQGTNAGGYFHQPGTYLLVYAYDASGNYQSKTVTPSQSTQEVTADSGYDALRKVTVNPIPSEYIVPTGNLAITSNTASGQSLDVSQYATATVNVPTGGGSASVATTTWSNSSNTATSHQFTNLSGTPKAAFLRCTSSLSRSSGSSNYFIADMVWNGTSCKGNSFRRSNGTYANVTSGYTVTTGSNSITFTSSGTSTTNPGSFYNGTYELTYVY